MGACGCLGSDSTSKPFTGKQRIEFENQLTNIGSRVVHQPQVFETVEKSLLPLILEKIPWGVKQLRMIFRASQHSFSAAKFHERTDGKSNFLLLVRTSKGRIFGAFSPCRLRNNTLYQYEKDQEGLSFIFTIKPADNTQQTQQIILDQLKPPKTRHELHTHNIIDKEKAIMNHQNAGPIIGQGHDILIVDRCNQNDSWCNIGKTYQSPHPFGSNKSNQLLSGESRFLIAEYQIWQLDS